MLLNPAIIALTLGSLLLSFFAVYASYVGLRIIFQWDLASGSDLQVSLERKTYLISTILAYLMAYELLSFFLFVHTADHLHEVFVGAMCAAGSLNVNPYGYSTLLVKVLNVVLCGIWLILNHVDHRGYDYPLIRPKYKLLLVITFLFLLETELQLRYFGALRRGVITACCGALFNEGSSSVSGYLSGVPAGTGKILLFASLCSIVGIGLRFLFTERGAEYFAILSSWFFIFCGVALVSFISVYYYELPTHHCPFCLLQPDYRYIGYAFYLSALMGGTMGLGVGVLNRYREIPSLRKEFLGIQKRLCLGSMIGNLCFTAIASYPMIFSDFTLQGY
jgi:hypothetical protein